jgi:Ring finger domain
MHSRFFASKRPSEEESDRAAEPRIQIVTYKKAKQQQHQQQDAPVPDSNAGVVITGATGAMSPLAHSDNVCAICLESMKDPTITNGCSHRFCFECIDQWGAGHRTCPLCKETFTAIESKHTKNWKELPQLDVSEEDEDDESDDDDDLDDDTDEDGRYIPQGDGDDPAYGYELDDFVVEDHVIEHESDSEEVDLDEQDRIADELLRARRLESRRPNRRREDSVEEDWSPPSTGPLNSVFSSFAYSES